MKLAAVFLASVMSGSLFAGEVSNTKEYCEFSSNKPIEAVRILEDFGGNKFKLYELFDGYAIYGVDNSGEIFIEGSYKSNSPYYPFLNNELRYLGPGNYFYINNNHTYNAYTQLKMSDNLNESQFRLKNKLTETGACNLSQTMAENTKIDDNNFTVINRAEYFKKLTYFPENWFGECGLIALSMMLSYYDTFYNDDFIPNGLEYGARYYTDLSTRSSGSGNYVLAEIKNENVTRKIGTNYKIADEYDFAEWPRMPGTTYAMRDYLFDNYMHTYLGIGSEDKGYPMMDGELKSTFNDYVEGNCAHLKNKFEIKSGHIWSVSSKVKDLINQGWPTCLVLQKYDTNLEDVSGKEHVVVAYGYQDGKFLTHFGWDPTTFNYTEVVLNSATIYGYFSIIYSGEHIHSRNAIMSANGYEFGLCGCGDIALVKTPDDENL